MASIDRMGGIITCMALCGTNGVTALVYVCLAVGVVPCESLHPTATSVIRQFTEGIIRWAGRTGQGSASGPSTTDS